MVVVKVLYFVFLVDCGRFTKGSWPNHLLATCSTYLKGEFNIHVCTAVLVTIIYTVLVLPVRLQKYCTH